MRTDKTAYNTGCSVCLTEALIVCEHEIQVLSVTNFRHVGEFESEYQVVSLCVRLCVLCVGILLVAA
jgi:hypothetical protein